MTDRELLELAAKAAGIEIDKWVENGCDDFGNTTGFIIKGNHNYYWNPILDDGDALRLAVKLGMCLQLHAIAVEYSKGTGQVGIIVEQAFRNLELTRRAIVRAAAKIGKG